MLRNKQSWLKANKITVQLTTNEDNITEVQIYQIDRKTNTPVLLKQAINVKHHKYGKDCIYSLVFPWDYEHGKRVTMTTQRIVYLYFKGDIAEGYDIDHIDGDSLNNEPNNLQALTRKDNLKKRQLTQREISKNYREIEKDFKISQQNIV